MTFVETLEPQALWKHFDRLLTIPRGSKEEDEARAYVTGRADALGLEYDVDDTGNVVVRKGGTPGHEDAPITILQGHLDMVNEKNSDVEHDFSKDPIQPERDGDYLMAKGTTLGSDNGIGVAAMLALMESDDVAHGPLELLFTVDEETGLTGAGGLDGSMLQGRRLLNLDSEEEGTVTVGCAGGGDDSLTLPLETEAVPDGSVALRLRVHGMRGGHSGIDIHLQRANAVKVLGRIVHAAAATPLRLAAFRGGNKHNAIPREADAVVVVPADDRDTVAGALDEEFAAAKAEHRTTDPDMSLSVEDADVPDRAWTPDTTHTAFALIEALPHGVIMMSPDIPGLVETSTNLATVVMEDDAMVIGTSSRSSVASALTALRRRIRATGVLAGAEVEAHGGYPGWEPDLDSALLATFKEVHARVVGSEPEVMAIHAGLECGIIGEKVPGMDMISFGPTIENPHSPDERVHIASVERFHDLLTTLLEELAR